MYADFGVYVVINGKPYHTLLAELGRDPTDDAVHKDFFVVLTVRRESL